MSPNDKSIGANGLSASRIANVASATVFAVLGAYVLLESGSMQWLGAVTPRLVGAGLIVLSVLLGGLAIIGPPEGSTQHTGSPLRKSQALFVSILAAWIAALPYLGFVSSSFIGFVAISFSTPRIAAWTPASAIMQVLGAAIATLGAWALLALVLDIPLPVGTIVRALGA